MTPSIPEDQQVRKAVEEGHRVEIEFDGQVPYVKLLHPEGGCSPGECQFCGCSLGEVLEDDEERCRDCEDGPFGECWLTHWAEEQGAEILKGKVVLAVDPEWDMDHAVLNVIQPPPADAPNVISPEEARLLFTDRLHLSGSDALDRDALLDRLRSTQVGRDQHDNNEKGAARDA